MILVLSHQLQRKLRKNIQLSEKKRNLIIKEPQLDEIYKASIWPRIQNTKTAHINLKLTSKNNPKPG